MRSQSCTPLSGVRRIRISSLRSDHANTALLLVAVGAFRVVVELDMKRRDNDKKIAVLFVEMRDMMGALLQCAHNMDLLVTYTLIL